MLRILIADDSTLAREALMEVINDDNEMMVAGVAANGRETVKKAADLRPDLVTMDLLMPDMSGVDILKRLKENEHLKRSPVVVLTTTDDAVEIKRCYDLGCNVYITKPVNYESFAHAIRQLGLFFTVIQVPAPV